MITKTKLNIVLDIGKTNVKLIFVDAKNTTVCSYKTQQKSIKQYGIKTLNSNSIFEWTIKKISLIEKKYQLDKFVCTTHGCSIALIDHNNQEILACTDYEYKYDQIMNDYKKIAPKFDLTKVDAEMENGLLKISIPLTKEAKPKAIKIK